MVAVPVHANDDIAASLGLAMRTLAALVVVRMAADRAHAHRDTAAAVLLAVKAQDFVTQRKRRPRPLAAETPTCHDSGEGDRGLDTQGGDSNL